MWPFRTQAEENLLDVQKKLAAAQGGANMTPQGKEFWNALPPGQRTDQIGLTPDARRQTPDGMPPGTPTMPSGLPPGAPPMGTMAQEQQNAWNRGSNIVAEAAVPIRQGLVFSTRPDYGRAPGAVAAVNARPPSTPGEYPMQVPGSTGSVFHSLLGANEMKITRGEDGSVTQVTKQIHPPGQTPDAGPAIAGGRQTTDLMGPPPGAAPISGPPPGTTAPSMLGPTPSEQRFGRTRNWDEFNQATNARAMAAGLIPDAQGQLSDEALRRQSANTMNSVGSRQAAERELKRRTDERLQRDQMGSAERIAQSQGAAAAAKITIPEQAANERARQELQNRRDITGMDIASREKIAQEENTRRLAEGQQKTTLTAEERLRKLQDDLVQDENKNIGSLTGMPETIGKYYRRTYNPTTGQLLRDNNGQPVKTIPERELMLNQSNQRREQLGMQPYIRAGVATSTAAAGAAGMGVEKSPRPGANKAPDGKWYIPDPNRPGKYLQVT